jgi:hypothetical protein
MQYRYNYYTAQRPFDEMSIRSITVENSKVSPGQDSSVQLIRPQLLQQGDLFLYFKNI